MRCFYLIFVLSVCECFESQRWYGRGYGERYRESNDGYVGDINDDTNYEVNTDAYKAIDYKKYGVSFYGYENDNYDDRNYNRQFDTKRYDDKRDEKRYNDQNDDRRYQGNLGKYFERRKYRIDNDKCRYIGPLYDFRKLDQVEYRANNRYYDNKDGRNRYGIYDRCEIYDGKMEDIIRPCSLNDLQCIRKFLAANSDCKPAYGPQPDPLLIPVDKFFIPVINVTVTHTNLRVRGFDSAKITEFYLNKETGNLVIAINVKNLNQTSQKTFFTYQRTAKEPIVLADFTTVTFSSITFTAVLPFYPRLRLDKAEIHAYFDDNFPTYEVGPRISASTDPDVIDAFSQIPLRLETIIQEAYVFQSFLLTGVYIQKSICDFGIDVYGNYLRFLKSKGFVVSLSDSTSLDYKDLGSKG